MTNTSKFKIMSMLICNAIQRANNLMFNLSIVQYWVCRHLTLI